MVGTRRTSVLTRCASSEDIWIARQRFQFFANTGREMNKNEHFWRRKKRDTAASDFAALGPAQEKYSTSSVYFELG